MAGYWRANSDFACINVPTQRTHDVRSFVLLYNTPPTDKARLVHKMLQHFERRSTSVAGRCCLLVRRGFHRVGAPYCMCTDPRTLRNTRVAVFSPTPNRLRFPHLALPSSRPFPFPSVASFLVSLPVPHTYVIVGGGEWGPRVVAKALLESVYVDWEEEVYLLDMKDAGAHLGTMSSGVDNKLEKVFALKIIPWFCFFVS